MVARAFAALSIARKVAAIVVLLVATVVVALAGWVFPAIRAGIYAERQAALRQSVETVYTLVGYYGGQAERGRMSDDDARKAAVAAVNCESAESAAIWPGTHASLRMAHGA